MSNQLSQAKDIYTSLINKKITTIVILLCLIIITLIINLFAGSADFGIKETLSALVMRGENDLAKFIIWKLRMPMALAAIVIGAALAVAGCEMQTILRNPMASPYTLGISSAASLGAALAIVLKVSLIPVAGHIIVTANSFLFTILAAGALNMFAKNKSASRNSLILFGIALNFLFSALTQLLQYLASEESLQTLTFWSFGSLTRVDWTKLAIITGVFIFVTFLFLKNSWKLTAMTTSDETAMSLGIDPKSLRRRIILLVALMSATVVSSAGTIGFVGLVAPHISRIIAGEEQRFFIIISALIGSFILSIASILSKVLIKGIILPIGLMTSIIGVPFFTYLIFSGARRNA